MFDGNQLTEMYERMRVVALRSSNKAKGEHSFGQVVLVQKGILAWAKTCCQLSSGEPRPTPVKGKIVHLDRVLNVGYELKNVLTQMALKAIEGERDANVDGI